MSTALVRDIDGTIRRHAAANKRHALAVALLMREPTLRQILVEVALGRKMLIEDVLPVSRDRHVVYTMHEFFYRALTETSASTVLIGHISARDHTAVMYGAAKWAHVKGLPPARGYHGAKYFNNYRKQKGAEAHGA